MLACLTVSLSNPGRPTVKQQQSTSNKVNNSLSWKGQSNKKFVRDKEIMHMYPHKYNQVYYIHNTQNCHLLSLPFPFLLSLITFFPSLPYFSYSPPTFSPLPTFPISPPTLSHTFFLPPIPL